MTTSPASAVGRAGRGEPDAGQVVARGDVRHGATGGQDTLGQVLEAPVRQRAVDHGVVVGGAGLLVGRGVGLGEPVQDDLAGQGGQVRLVGGPGAEVGGEAGEPLGEVDVQRELRAVAGQERRVEGRQLLGGLGHDPRRRALHPDLVCAQVELEQAEVAVPALVGHLVVHDDLRDVVAEVVLLHQPRGPVVVPVQGHEDLVVGPDQPLPQPQPVGGLARGDAVGVDVEQVVRGQDDRHVRVLGHDGVGPGEGRVGGPPGQGEHHELVPLGLEHMELVHAGRVAAAVGGLLGRTLGAEPAQVRLGGQVVLLVEQVVVGVAHVVVAGQHRVGQATVLQRGHGAVGHLPLALGVDLVHDVPQVRHERDAELVGVLDEPLGLRGVGVVARAVAVRALELRQGVAGVELRVGHDREREPGAEVGRGLDRRGGAGRGEGEAGQQHGEQRRRGGGPAQQAGPGGA